VALLLVHLGNPQKAEAVVVKITQTKALNGNVTPGDAPGFPVTISRSGSYVLDTNLSVAANKDGIDITASHVTINLNGFTIQGSGGTLGSGIRVSLTGKNSITVMNGSITGMASDGIVLSAINILTVGARVEGMSIHDNNGTGISVGTNSKVTGNQCFKNKLHGITTRGGSVVADNSVIQNGVDGITVEGATVAHNTILGNGGDGIVAPEDLNLIIANTISFNGGFGIVFCGSTFCGGYRENVISENLGGTISGGVNMGNNVCDADLICP
jgi:hypothetical protein